MVLEVIRFKASTSDEVRQASLKLIVLRYSSLCAKQTTYAKREEWSRKLGNGERQLRRYMAPTADNLICAATCHIPCVDGFATSQNRAVCTGFIAAV